MPDHDVSSHRLFVDAALVAGASVEATREAANYLANVLRLRDGDGILVFNGKDGEWRAVLGGGRKQLLLTIHEQVRPQTPHGDLWYCFAPLKAARLDYMVQKAVEMGASRLVPVMTRHTQVSRVNLDRMRANVVEAAEQCGILAIADVADALSLESLIASWEPGRALALCDEHAPVADPLPALRALAGRPMAVLVGPEGGFAPDERVALSRLPGMVAIALGPRVLRADTAAVAALAVLQAAAGDWVAPGAPSR